MKITEKGNAHFTNYNYLSINKQYLNTTSDEVIIINNTKLDLNKLKRCIDYSDNVRFYRWSKSTWRNCIIK